MLKFATTSLEYCKPWNEDSTLSMELSAGLRCSQRDVCQDHREVQLVLMKVVRISDVL